MVDYAKKTVAELQEILKSRSLAASGKKADLVSRLTEADKAAEENAEQKAPTAEATSAPPEQSTDDHPEQSAVPPPASATAADTTAKTTTDTSDAIGSPSANTDTALAQSADYALHLPQSDVDAEIAKRKARADRFGTGNTAANGEAAGAADSTAEAERAAERAKRFGITGTTAIGRLDEALPTERERGSRKRGRPEEAAVADAALDDPGLRRNFRGQRGGARGGGRRNNSRRGDKPTGVQKSSGGAVLSEKDRAAADARKKRFNAT